MLSKSEYNIRKSALKRAYNDALANADVSGILGNPFVAEGLQRQEARKALRGRGAYTPMYTGSGGYFKDFGGSIGRELGGALGYKKIGGQIGRALGSRASHLTGMGAYETQYNQLFPSLSNDSVMSVTGIPGEFGGLCVDHTEYVANIYGNTSDFSNQTYAINAGLEKAFPWLSQIACNFEEYQLEQLVYEFQSTVTDQGVSSNGQVGTIIIATQYNASAEPFTDIQSMLQYDGVQTSMVTKDCVHGVECDPMQRSGDLHLYIRANPVVYGEDLKTYDHGVLNIAQQGVATSLSNQLIGRLFVKYRVRLMKPRFYSGRGLDISKDIFHSNTSVTRDTWLGTEPCKGQQNNIGIAVAKSAARTYQFTLPATWSGTMKVQLMVETLGTLTGNASITLAGAGLSFIADVYGVDNDSDSPGSTYLNYSGTSAVLISHVKVSPASGGTNNVVTLVGPNMASDAALLDSYVEICEYNAGVTTPPVWVKVSNSNVIVTID